LIFFASIANPSNTCLVVWVLFCFIDFQVKVVRLISKGTIEEMVYLRQIYKSHLKKETLEGNVDKNSSAPRVFRGVQGDSDRKGELFGTENLFRFKDGSFLETIWAEAGGGGPRAQEGRRSMGGLEVHDTAKLSSALLGMGEDYERVLEEKDAINDIATIASRVRKKIKKADANTTANHKSDSESDSELDDTLNVKTRAVNHNDLMRSDKGGAKISANDEEAAEEMGGGTQDAFQVYERVAGPDLEESDEEEEQYDVQDDVQDIVDKAERTFEPTDVFKKFGQSDVSAEFSSAISIAPVATVPVLDRLGSSFCDAKGNSASRHRESSPPNAVPDTIGSFSDAPEGFGVPFPSSNYQPPSKLTKDSKHEAPLKPSASKKGSSLFGCGDMRGVATTFSAADLGLDDFSTKKKKKRKN
jgi:hypothetical protein